MRKHYSKTLFLTSLFTIVTGCQWDETEYNKYVSDDGTLELCPNQNQSGELFFIEVSANPEEQTDPDATNQNIIRCAQTCDGSIADCVPMTDLRCVNYAGSFKHKLCPKNTLCLPWQDDATKLYCGKPIIECRTAEDCKFTEGWVTGDCIDDKCVAKTCDDNYHITTNGKCEIDSIEHCGSENNKCADLKSERHALTFKCEEQTCKPIECEIGYHLNPVTHDTCENDTADLCGGIVCRLSNAGWSDGTCEMILNKPQCNATQCQEGYHLTLKAAQNGNNNATDTNTNDEDEDTNPNDEEIDTNENYYLCEIDDDDHCGGAKTIDALNTIQSVNCKTKIKENGVELYYCKKVEDEEGRIKSSCDIAKCADNYHWNQDNTGCEKNDTTHCGSFNNDCFKIIPGSEPDKLVCSDKFKCYTKQCKAEYFGMDYDEEVEAYSDCLLYTNTTCLDKKSNEVKNCARDGKVCVPDEMDSSASEPSYSCQENCGKEMDVCHDDYGNMYCANLKTDILHCGDCETECKTVLPYTQPVCLPSLEDASKGACAIQCQIGFIDYNGIDEDGCEFNLYAHNVTECSTCDPKNDAECICDPKNGAECKAGHKCTCMDGYANCDDDWSNGCEIKFDDYGLKSCKECTNDYTNCGLTNNDTVALCLKEGHETWTWSDGSHTYTTDWGWGHRWYYKDKSEWSEDGSSGSRIRWDYTDKTNSTDHICQYLCNVDYGINHPHYKKNTTSNCYNYSSAGKLYHSCNDENVGTYWTYPTTCQPKQKCYLKHNFAQSLQPYCGDQTILAQACTRADIFARVLATTRAHGASLFGFDLAYAVAASMS